MATKKKSKKNQKKSPRNQTDSRTWFWSYVAAIILFLFAVFIFIGGFKSGGSLPIDLFKYSYDLFGWASYFFCGLLIYIGVYKFLTEDRRVPLTKLVNIFILLLLTSSWFQVTFDNLNLIG